MIRATANLTALLLLLAGCASSDDDTPEIAAEETFDPANTAEGEDPADDDPTYSEVCGDAVVQAAAVDDMQDRVTDLDPAIAACRSIEEFQAAVEDNPGVIDVDATTWATNRCADPDADESVTGSSICSDVAG